MSAGCRRWASCNQETATRACVLSALPTVLARSRSTIQTVSLGISADKHRLHKVGGLLAVFCLFLRCADRGQQAQRSRTRDPCTRMRHDALRACRRQGRAPWAMGPASCTRRPWWATYPSCAWPSSSLAPRRLTHRRPRCVPPIALPPPPPCPTRAHALGARSPARPASQPAAPESPHTAAPAAWAHPLPPRRTQNGWTALHIAAAKGFDVIARELTARGASVGVVDRDGRSPLHLAAAQGHDQVVKDLLRRGANPGLVDQVTCLHDCTPAHLLPPPAMFSTARLWQLLACKPLAALPRARRA